MTDLEFPEVVNDIANILKLFDSERPIHKEFKPGIGPFGEPQLVKEICTRLNLLDTKYRTRTKRTPDLDINSRWAVEFKIVRPYGDNGKEAENWSVNLLHPYPGNVSLIGDLIKLSQLNEYPRQGLFVIGFEHYPAKISLDPLLSSFEVIVKLVINAKIGNRIEVRKCELVHPEHQVVRCIGWELFK